ncbi:MAG: heavy metal-associated domain-containing protein [Bacteroidales bacterium]|jgi:copper chaperone CopZ
MKTKVILANIIATIGLILLFSGGCFSQDKKLAEIKVKTSSICSQCKNRIEQGMAYEKGIKDINLDVDSKIATITYNPLKTNPAEIRLAISKLGYDADTIPANKDAYNKLPPCCKKKDSTDHN